MSEVRQPIVAGRFYASSTQACAEEVRNCIPTMIELGETIEQPCGAIVPHAGWAFSGRVAGKVLKYLAEHSFPQTVVLLGAVHTAGGSRAAVYEGGAWRTPLGEIAVDDQLAQAVLGASDLLVKNRQAHNMEHSLEVQVPFIQELFPNTRILPVMVPPLAAAAEVGKAIGRVLIKEKASAVVVGTTDLTHYGPSYGMTMHGAGQEGLDWAKNENDRRMIDLILAMDAESIVPEAAEHHNACGAGAVAATMSACLALGATRAILVEHTTSAEALRDGMSSPVRDAVGYGGFLFGR